MLFLFLFPMQLPPKENLTNIFKNLKYQIRNETKFLKTKLGTQLWVDGVHAIKNTTIYKFREIINEVFPYIMKSNDDFFIFFDTWLRDTHNKISLENKLSVGIAYLISKDIIQHQNISHSLTIISDTIAYLLSPSYRHIRNLGHDLNCRVEYTHIEPQLIEFQPQNKITHLSKPFVTDQDILRISYYSANHELIHMSLVDHVYKSPVTDESTTILNYLIAETIAITVDIQLAREISSVSPQLYLIDEIIRIQSCKQESNITHKKISPLEKALKNYKIQRKLEKNMMTFFKKIIFDKKTITNSEFTELFNYINQRTLYEHYLYAKNKMVNKFLLINSNHLEKTDSNISRLKQAIFERFQKGGWSEIQQLVANLSKEARANGTNFFS